MKRIFTCVLCIVLLLSGCGVEIKHTGNDVPSSDTASLDIGQYDGEWYGENYVESVYVDTGDIIYEFGVMLALDTKNSKVAIYDISSSEPSRIAAVDVEYEIKGSKAGFKFDDDGWGNAGHGTITFGSDELEVDIILDSEPGGNWKIFEGKTVLTRKKFVKEVSDENIGEVEYSGDETAADDGGMDIRFDSTSFDLDRPVDFKDLVNLTADELGILRNAIYARYGYIFKTKKYADYFSGFDWYSPSSEDVNSKLTENDKSNIALIQKVERFNEKNVKPGEEEKKLIGFWNCGAGVAAGYSNAYRFYEDGTYKFNNSQMVMDERNVAHAGKWFVLDGYLYLRMEREGVLVGGELVDAEHPGSATEKEIVGASYTVRPLDSFKTVVLRLDFDSNKIEKDNNSNGVVIGTLDFYKLSTGPDDIYDGLDV